MLPASSSCPALYISLYGMPYRFYTLLFLFQYINKITVGASPTAAPTVVSAKENSIIMN
jgi:hypothetical protein